jgi:CPA2 family monovalent cation:H+ antiporter-2
MGCATSSILTGVLGASGEGDRLVVGLLVILAIAGLIAMLVQRFRMAVVPAYLLAGLLVGPHALGLVGSEERLAEVSRLAVILLMFGIGLELDVALLRRGLGRMVLVGVGSCVVCTMAGWPLALLMGLRAPAALAVSMALAMSSTAVVLRIISARRELRRRSGRLALAVLVVQDVLVLVILALLPVVAEWSSGSLSLLDGQLSVGTAEFARRAALRIGGLALLVVAAKALLPAVLRESLRAGRLEVMLLVGLAAALAAAVAAGLIGLSEEMGAFLAGFVLAGTPFRHQLSAQVGPLRDIFSALFFTTVGMKVDPAIVAGEWGAIGLGVALIVAVKSLVIGGACWSAGALASTSVIVGLYLAQAGEFSLVLIEQSRELGIVGERVAAEAISMVVVSLLITPALADAGRRLARLCGRVPNAPWVHSVLDEIPPEPGAAEQGPRHVVIGGFGPVGRRVAEELDRAGASYTVIELNPETVREQLRMNRSIVFGDVSNPHVLETAGIGRADALVLTIPDEDAVMRACAVAKRRSPQIFVAARTALVAKSHAATHNGADAVVVDEMATAEAMLRVVIERLQRPAAQGAGPEAAAVAPAPHAEPGPPLGSAALGRSSEPPSQAAA